VMAILRAGRRSFSQDELVAADVPGALPSPGEPLMQPAYPPVLPPKNFQWWDPVSGPKLATDELLPDGGDIGPRVGIGPNGHLGNLDSTDTAMEYRADGKLRATTSNRVCLFAPRFPIIREELMLAGNIVSLPPAIAAQAAAIN